MRVLCDTKALVEALNLIGSVTVGKAITVITRCVHLQAANGVLHLSGTDLEIGLRLRIGSVEVQEDGESLVPAHMLSQIVRACDDTTLILASNGDALSVTGASSNFKIFGSPPKEAPPVRDFEGMSVDCQVHGATMQRLINSTIFCAANEHSRYAINGLMLERKAGYLRTVATDGRRLAVAIGKVEGGKGHQTTLVPTKAMAMLNKLVDDPEVQVKIAHDKNQVVFSVGDGVDDAILSSNLIEGSFPPFEDVIPKDQDKKVVCETAVILAALRKAALLTNDESKGVKMSFSKKGELLMTSRAPEVGEASVTVQLESYEGDELEVGFQPAYLIDALKVIGNGKVTIELKAPNKPGMVKSGAEFTYVVMPVNLQ